MDKDIQTTLRALRLIQRAGLLTYETATSFHRNLVYQFFENQNLPLRFGGFRQTNYSWTAYPEFDNRKGRGIVEASYCFVEAKNLDTWSQSQLLDVCLDGLSWRHVQMLLKTKKKYENLTQLPVGELAQHDLLGAGTTYQTHYQQFGLLVYLAPRFEHAKTLPAHLQERILPASLEEAITVINSDTNYYWRAGVMLLGFEMEKPDDSSSGS